MLSKLRQKIDAIDDAIIALLIERTEIVEEVGRLKAKSGDTFSFIRPGREATMLRRLIDKVQGPFPKAAIALLWRTIIAASLNIEQKLQVAVHVTENNNTPYWYSREYFGSFTEISTHYSASQVISDVAKGDASIGVVFFPQGQHFDPWWCNFDPSQHHLHVFARLPFIRTTNLEQAREHAVELLAFAKTLPEETGFDKTLLTIRLDTAISQFKLIQLLGQDGLQADYLAGVMADKSTQEKNIYMVEVHGFLINEHARINQLVHTLDESAAVTILGAYAVPLTI